MREILFRGKRVDNGKWVYGDLIHHDGYVAIWDKNVSYVGDFEVIPKTVGQYTGLRANGKKVFEEDIVTYAEDGLRGDFSQGVMEIVWNEKTAGFCGRTTQGRLVEIARQKNVIGNIHDNPELMEAKQ